MRNSPRSSTAESAAACCHRSAPPRHSRRIVADRSSAHPHSTAETSPPPRTREIPHPAARIAQPAGRRRRRPSDPGTRSPLYRSKTPRRPSARRRLPCASRGRRWSIFRVSRSLRALRAGRSRTAASRCARRRSTVPRRSDFAPYKTSSARPPMPPARRCPVRLRKTTPRRHTRRA